MRRTHDEDLKIKLLKKVLEKESYENYCVENGKKLLVVPNKMQNEIIRKHHEMGHFGTHI